MKKRDIHRAEPRRDTIKSHHIQEHRHDPYKARKKMREPTVCSQCTVVYNHGRWQWQERPPAGAHEELCPACHRTNDKYPAGEITLSGSFLTAHRDEIINLVRNTQQLESREHPLQRIMAIENKNDRVVILTTDVHLPRRIGHAIVDAYKGELDTHYDEEGYFIRMSWKRDS
jgi:hypothetical protein